MPHSARAVRTRVGRTIQRLRQHRGVTQDRLAELVGQQKSVKHISEIERGLANVGLDTLTRIAAVLSVDIVDLFTPGRGRPGAIEILTREDADVLVAIAARLRRKRAPRRVKRPVR
jgi:transcriptional regulator with XRE-family HTH domain